MSDYRELLIGCGRARDKRIQAPSNRSPEWRGVVTLDRNPKVKPDVVCNLDLSRWVFLHESEISAALLPLTQPARDFANDPYRCFKDEQFDEVHAYEVLEHLGSLGGVADFLGTMSEIWRVLKPDGYLCATVPSRFSPWLWGDPSHTRAILPETLVFLDQREYVKQCDGGCAAAGIVGRQTGMSDFRDIYRADFNIVESADNRQHHFFVLQAVKPSRWREPT